MALVEGMTALAARARSFPSSAASRPVPRAIIVDVTVTGTVHRRGVLTRSGGRAGDELYVTGSLGGAALGLRRLRVDPFSSGVAVDRYRRPEPRTRFGLMLGRNRAARACIDLSDGLADGVRQIGEASGLGAVIDAGALPIEEGATLHDALGGGEDYELLFAVSPRMRSRLRHARRLVNDSAVTRIGRRRRIARSC